MTHAQFAVDEGFHIDSGRSSGLQCDTLGLERLVEGGFLSRPPISHDELESRSKSDWLLKTIAILQISYYISQTLVRALQHIGVTPLEILVVAFIFCTVLSYAFNWSKPQGIQYPIIITHQGGATGTKCSTAVPQSGVPQPDIPQQDTTQQDTPQPGMPRESGQIVHCLTAFRPPRTVLRLNDNDTGHIVLPGPRPPEDLIFEGRTLLVLLPIKTSIIVATLFGAIHCLAWTSPFPHAAELLIWRICAIVTTCLPLPLVLHYQYRSDRFKFYPRFLKNRRIMFALGTTYAVARIILILLAFTALRPLPADTYQTVDWTRYLPNFSA